MSEAILEERLVCNKCHEIITECIICCRPLHKGEEIKCCINYQYHACSNERCINELKHKFGDLK